ncbi:hypothetical protein PHYSODRAFT_296330 [Phytophthora sojae]|uniref:Uncharacterized protein n=1 Tax=Phytophthora sojae (strain P6497) TaxID=1094619 RepID=G4YS28_PHYSP|nr:hypothetical protein PHYSODRAFT_296330 [Phytophthora sojae]EGZ24165.1 hypothetical protein PHYSODRAFT_296330 [Phytophthora sojae]|eukprot:XP_009519453.1 hypothetical protein PHYSODRAFT_296330 [Phytophthora sojae]
MTDLTASDTEADDAADARAVRQQVLAFGQGPAPPGSSGVGTTTPAAAAVAETSFSAVDEIRGRASTTFRPTTLEQQIHNAIGHPDHQGKDAQCILECAQQARETRFRAAHPILRGAFDFGFHIRGLSVMHFAHESRISTMEASGAVVNMTDFSRKNGLQPAAAEPSYTGLLEALTSLRHFGRKFYNAATVDVLNAAITFIEEFADGGDPDRETTKRLLLWINMKLGKFRGLVISVGLAAAVRVTDEFTLQDSLLSELLYNLQKAKLDKLTAMIEAQQHPSPKVRSKGKEHQLAKLTGRIPKSVARGLPKQGSQQLCLKHLSKMGCSGNGTPGQCFAKGRAHFRPTALSSEAKDHIKQHFGGLAPEFADL